MWFILPENVDFVENSYLCRYVLLPYRTKKTHRRTSEKSGMQNVVTDRTWVGLFADTSFCISKIGYISGSVRNSVTKFWHITRESMSCPKVWKSEFWKICSYVLLHRCRRYILKYTRHYSLTNPYDRVIKFQCKGSRYLDSSVRTNVLLSACCMYLRAWERIVFIKTWADYFAQLCIKVQAHCML